MQSEQQQRIMGYFIEEAKDHLETIEKGLLNLQGTIGDPELISEVFRAAHSVKGGAAMLGLDSIQHTSHRLEDYFKVLKECPVTVDQKLETLFLRVFDTLQDLLEQLQGPFGLTQEKASEIMQAVEPAFGQLHNHLNGLVTAAGGEPLEEHHAVIPVQDTSTSSADQQSNELQSFFQKTVAGKLRSLLAEFKQTDTPASRQTLQEICQSLSSQGKALGASSGWQDLVQAARKAIACEDNSYRPLALVIIKALKEAQELGSQNRGDEITINQALLNLVPDEEEALDLTQADDLMDSLLADASRDADEVLDTVMDDALALEGDLDSLGLEEDLMASGAESSEPSSDAAELSNLLDIGDSTADSDSSLEEELDIDWLQNSLADPSSSEDDDWLSDSAAADNALEDSLGLIDELDDAAVSSKDNSADVGALLDSLDETTTQTDSDDQVGPQVGPDEMDSLADLFAGDSDELNLDWDASSVQEETDELSDELDLDGTSDFSDLLFDAGGEEDDIPQDLTADEDDISTLLNTLELDSTEQDNGELATTPLSENVDPSSADSSLDDLLASMASEDEDQSANVLTDSAPDDDFFALDNGSPDSTNDEQATNSPGESSELDNLGAFFGGDEDAVLETEGSNDSQALTAPELSSDEFDELFVGLDSEEAIFENQAVDELQDSSSGDLEDSDVGDLSDIGFDEDSDAAFEGTEATGGTDDVLGDLWAEASHEEEADAIASSTPIDLETQDIWGDAVEDESESAPASASTDDVDALDSLFGSSPSPEPSSQDAVSDTMADSFDIGVASEASASEAVEESLHFETDTSESLEALGLESDIAESHAFEGMTVSEDANPAEAMDDFALEGLADLATDAEPSSLETDLGFDLGDLGMADSEVPDPDLPSEEVADAILTDNPPPDSNPDSEEESLDDVLEGIFDQDTGSEPIITDHDIPAMVVPDGEAGVDLATMFMNDVADDASVTFSLDDTDGDMASTEDSELDAALDDLGLTDSADDHLSEELGFDNSQDTTGEGDFADLEMLLTPDAPSNNGELDELDALLDAPADDSIEGLAVSETMLDSSLVEEADEFADLDALLSEPAVDQTNLPAAGEGDVDDFADLEKLLEDADQSLGGPPKSSSEARQAASPQRRPARRGLSNQTMRVAVKNLDNLNNLVGELVVNRNSLEQSQERLRQFLDNLLYQVQQLSDVGQRMRDLYERSLLESSLLSSRRSYQATIPGDSTATDSSHATGASFDALEMDRFTGFHTLSQEMIELIVRVRESASDIDFVVDESDQVTRMFRQVTTQLQEGLTRTRMVPFAQAADRLPRAVRDISIKCGKQAKLVVEGRDTLIDKMILEQLYDPMTHLVNNAITHGIEAPDERVEKNKTPVGTITIRSFHQGNQTIISVTDDGGGINPEVVSRKAIEKGLITKSEAEEMSRLDIYDLLFHHGFSTRDKADDFAGRGVGMDVVRTSLGEIRGVVNIDSTIDQGTTFTIRLPLTLSISKALLCVSNRARIAFPMDGVEDMLDVPQDRIQADDQGRPSIMWRDILLPFRPLSDLLKFHRSLGRGSVYGGGPEDDVISVVVLRSGGNYLALQVDQVLGEQEIVIKQLEAPIPKPTGIAGATVLGDGRIMPIADVLELIDLSMGRIRRDAGSQLWEQSEDMSVSDAAVTASEPTVLIVDDSITVRELLSMTFNKVGYRVEQARDGQEAWEKLRSGLPCDLVFCDIEMPRMDGLELLSRLQKDSNFSRLPIAMLTSRGADRHRQMAVQLGAKGYFTKPYLEEALLDAAQRMLKGEVLVGSDG